MTTPETPYFLGLDAGTQSLKALVIDDHLTARAEYAVTFDHDLPQFGTQGGVHRHADKLTVTAPPLMWVAALDRLLGRMRDDGFPFQRLAALSGSGQQHGSVYWAPGAADVLQRVSPAEPLHTQLAPVFALDASPVWMDSSTTVQCRALESALGGAQAVAELTGSRAYERFTANQIAKIYQTQPEPYARSERISLVSSFMAGLMTGTVAPIDFSDGSGMNLLDIRKRTWAPAALRACAPDLAPRLGAPVPSHTCLGAVAPYFRERYGFPETCRVIAFSGDNPNSLAGLRLQEAGDIAVSLGTSDTLFGSLRDPRPSGREGHVFVNPIDSEAYMAMICFKNGSLTREWVRDRVAAGSWKEFGAAFARTPPGNHGRIGMFFIEPEITPPVLHPGCFRFDAAGRPVSAFDADGEVRAVVESQFMAMRLHGDRLGLRPRRLLVTGGASRDPVMLRGLADVFGVPVAVIDQRDSAALGAAYRAFHGYRCASTGRAIPFADILPEGTAPRTAAEPDPEAHRVYDAMLERFAQLEARVVAHEGR